MIISRFNLVFYSRVLEYVNKNIRKGVLFKNLIYLHFASILICSFERFNREQQQQKQKRDVNNYFSMFNGFGVGCNEKATKTKQCLFKQITSTLQ